MGYLIFIVVWIQQVIDGWGVLKVWRKVYCYRDCSVVIVFYFIFNIFRRYFQLEYQLFEWKRLGLEDKVREILYLNINNEECYSYWFIMLIRDWIQEDGEFEVFLVMK